MCTLISVVKCIVSKLEFYIQASIYWYIAPQMEQFFVFKILHEGFVTVKICMHSDIANPN